MGANEGLCCGRRQTDEGQARHLGRSLLTLPQANLLYVEGSDVFSCEERMEWTVRKVLFLWLYDLVICNVGSLVDGLDDIVGVWV